MLQIAVGLCCLSCPALAPFPVAWISVANISDDELFVTSKLDENLLTQLVKRAIFCYLVRLWRFEMMKRPLMKSCQF